MNNKTLNKQEKNHYLAYTGFVKFIQISSAAVIIILILMQFFFYKIIILLFQSLRRKMIFQYLHFR